MTATEHRQIDSIEKERRRREEALLLFLLLLVGGSADYGGRTQLNRRSALRLATDAVGLGHSADDAIRRVLYGDPALHLPGLPTTLARAMTDAWMTGYQRAFRLAGIEPVSVTPPPGWAAAEAQTVTHELYTAVTGTVRQAIDQARTLNLATPRVQRAIRDALTRYGFTARAPQTVNPDATGSPGYALANVATDTVLKAWGNGYAAGIHNPAVLDRLTALRHRSILDNRTSKWCDDDSGRPGLTLPPHDAYWRSNWPPLHPRCRSVVLPIFNAVQSSEDYPTVDPLPGFGIAPGPFIGHRP